MSRVVRPLAIGLAGLLVAAVVLGGWAWWTRHRQVTVPPTTPLAEQCEDVPDGAERTTLTGQDGETLGGALLGPADAELGLVLRQGASQTICDWLPWAADVAEETGARVLLFDRRGMGSSPAAADLAAEPGDLRIAVRRLRADGAQRTALVASSMGNAVTYAALPELKPAPCVVVSISPVLVASGAGTVDGSDLTDVPANTWVAWETQNSGVAAGAEAIAAAAAAPHELPVDTDHHSRQLVINHPEVEEFVLDGIRSCA